MVEIIPRPTEKEPSWRKILFYFSIFLFLAVIISYFVLNSLQNKAAVTIKNLDEELAKTKTAEFTSLEKQILNYQRKIKDFATLLSQHIFNTKFFQFLESITHPKVFFSQINLNSNELKVSLSGQADSFIVIGQQIMILEKEPLIESFSVPQMLIGKEGKIDFSLEMTLSPKVFK